MKWSLLKMNYVYEENEQQSYALAFIYPLLQPPVFPKY
jgi:hypothetical protein